MHETRHADRYQPSDMNMIIRAVTEFQCLFLFFFLFHLYFLIEYSIHKCFYEWNPTTDKAYARVGCRHKVGSNTSCTGRWT